MYVVVNAVTTVTLLLTILVLQVYKRFLIII